MINDRLEEIASLYSHLNRLNIIDVEFNSGHSLEVYVALEKADKAKGLSSLNSIDTDGMLFWYNEPTYRPYSMREMNFDLDIAWYDRNGKLLHSSSHEAGDPNPVTCPYAYHYVLEVPKNTLPISDLKLHG